MINEASSPITFLSFSTEGGQEIYNPNELGVRSTATITHGLLPIIRFGTWTSREVRGLRKWLLQTLESQTKHHWLQLISLTLGLQQGWLWRKLSMSKRHWTDAPSSKSSKTRCYFGNLDLETPHIFDTLDLNAITPRLWQHDWKRTTLSIITLNPSTRRVRWLPSLEMSYATPIERQTSTQARN